MSVFVIVFTLRLYSDNFHLKVFRCSTYMYFCMWCGLQVPSFKYVGTLLVQRFAASAVRYV